ncbi:nucleolar protein [Thalictrum thalictroides]|uniref:Nucleolar protein n=1 Tax=Thalictrum thalictroides TaxID=46969 RepID=A0A7J6XFD9_THATH|nr:nucleolar protein [Thalictrum thalictroides]
MARQLHLVNAQTSISHIGLGVATLFFCAIALIMCASHSRRWRIWHVCGSSSFEPIIQLNNEGIILATTKEHQFNSENEQNNSGVIEGVHGGSVWQKGILMGKKCQLPDYSGIITYDSEGKLTTKIGNSRLRQETTNWGN